MSLLSSGCGNISLLLDQLAGTSSTNSNITGSVSALDTTTGLPTALEGAVDGALKGTYSETILDVFFDADGMPTAAVSRSLFTIDTPEAGTLTTMNLILVVDTIVDDGTSTQAVPLGLATAATGEVIHGTGAFAGATGQLHTDSTLLFGGGEFSLGTIESDLDLTLSR